jgi:GT2 family glycosyltransferase
MIDIISLAWNGYDMTEKFLINLKRHTDIPHRLIFTDNGSTDPIPELVRKHYPDAKLIVKKENVGCPATRNEAMSFATSDIVFWLDNDTIVGPKWYQPILDKLEDPTIGISGPWGYTTYYPFNPKHAFYITNSGDCDFFMGYLMGFKRKYFKPINDYHMAVNLDDTELCLGIKENGMRCVVCEPCFAQHLTSQTKRGWSCDNTEKMKEFWKNWEGKPVFEKYT